MRRGSDPSQLPLQAAIDECPRAVQQHPLSALGALQGFPDWQQPHCFEEPPVEEMQLVSLEGTLKAAPLGAEGKALHPPKVKRQNFKGRDHCPTMTWRWTQYHTVLSSEPSKCYGGACVLQQPADTVVI